MTVKLPEKTHVLGGPLPSIPQRVTSWPWGSTPNLAQWSLSQLKHPLGTIIYEVVDDHPVLAQIQTHYSYGAHPEWPEKAHKGTSVFVPVATDPATGKSFAMREPPEGWGDESTMSFDWWIPAALVAGGAGGFVTGMSTASRSIAEWIGKNHPDWAAQIRSAPNAPHIAGEMYAKRRGGGYRFSGDHFGHDGSRFNPAVCDSFCVRRHGMMY